MTVIETAQYLQITPAAVVTIQTRALKRLRAAAKLTPCEVYASWLERWESEASLIASDGQHVLAAEIRELCRRLRTALWDSSVSESLAEDAIHEAGPEARTIPLRPADW